MYVEIYGNFQEAQKLDKIHREKTYFRICTKLICWKGIESFKQIQLVGLNLDATTFAIILPPCVEMRVLGQVVHKAEMKEVMVADFA